MKKAKLETVVYLLFFIYGVVFFTASLQWPYWTGYGPGGAFVPMWCNGPIAVLSAWGLISSLKKEGVSVFDAFPKGEGAVNLLITWGAVILFLLFVKKIGLIIASTMMLSILFKRGYSLHKAIALGFTVSIICFILFGVLLQVPLPVNKFGW